MLIYSSSSQACQENTLPMELQDISSSFVERFLFQTWKVVSWESVFCRKSNGPQKNRILNKTGSGSPCISSGRAVQWLDLIILVLEPYGTILS